MINSTEGGEVRWMTKTSEIGRVKLNVIEKGALRENSSPSPFTHSVKKLCKKNKEMMEIKFQVDKSSRIQSWKVKEGFFLPAGHVIFSYVELDDIGNPATTGLKRFKAVQSGVISKIHVPEGNKIEKGTTIITLGPCSHPTVMRDMCAECGMDLRKLDEPTAPSASVSMIHSVPDLRISMEQAQIIGKGDEERLLRQNKLVLLVDLDQTLIHTTNDNVPHNLKDVSHFQLYGHGPMWYHTRLRPGTRLFLEKISKLYELHICTFGTRSYAHVIARYLDPEGRFFSDRILSRDECFSQNSKTANLKELFPRGDHMVCIIDDREDVWNYAPNLIHVKPYHFFRHTGDINAPPGLTKQDEDDKTGFSFNKDGTSASVPAKADSSNEKVAEGGEDGAIPVETANTLPKEKVDEKMDVVDSKGETPEGLSTGPEADKNDLIKSEKDTTNSVREVKSDLCLSDEEDSGQSDKSEEEANEGDKEESGEEETKVKTPVSNETLPPVDPKEDPVQESLAVDNKSSKESNPIEKTDETSSDKTESKLKSVDTPDAVDKVDSLASDNPQSNATPDPSPNPEKIDEESPITKTKGVIEVEDPDDYLMYLEDILSSIHQAFYSLQSDLKTRGENKVPDVKNVIPYVRKKVLKNVSIVFSGVVPTEVPLNERKNTKAYSVATSLGAHISERIIPPNKPSGSNEIPTTHVVAARLGTAKVNEARRYKGIHVVTPDWLWCCSERWKHVDERLFPLYKKSIVKRIPPSHCTSPSLKRREFSNNPNAAMAFSKNGQRPAARKERTPSGRFMDTINPLLSFSMDEIESMGHEVDDICNESESSSSDDEDEIFKEKALRRRSSRSKSDEIISELDQSVSEVTKESSSTSDSNDSNSEVGLDSNELVSCRKRKRAKKTETETEDEPLTTRFRRGEPLPSEVEYLNLMNATSDDDATNDHEEEWMAQALEREFLDESSRDQD